MKKNLLLACLFLTLAAPAFAAEAQNAPSNAEIKQKACQNVFSFINIDLSVMSPRAAVSDVSVTDPQAPENKKGAIEQISNKREIAPPPKAPMEPKELKSKTSLFRLDLFGIFKLQVL